MNIYLRNDRLRKSVAIRVGEDLAVEVPKIIVKEFGIQREEYFSRARESEVLDKCEYTVTSRTNWFKIKTVNWHPVP
jgi:hypothetical protein